MYRRGFTIVELLIVIVIIAILAAVTVAAYNGIRERSQASAIASDLKAITKAFVLYKESNGLSSWPIETDTSWKGTGGTNPFITEIIAYNASFREFLPRAAANAGLGGNGPWLYDNELDTYVNCAVNSNGVNIIAQNVTNTAVAQLIDEALDDGDLNCGTLHLSGTSLIYNLSKTP